MRVSTPGRRVTAMILMAIVAFWSTALCLASEGSPHVSHGCCAKLESPHQRVRIAAPRVCCGEDTANYDAAMPLVAGASAPSAFIIARSVLHHGHVLAAQVARRIDLDAARPPGRPTYVLISIFRV